MFRKTGAQTKFTKSILKKEMDLLTYFLNQKEIY